MKKAGGGPSVPVRMRDVAALAGVDTSVVSRVLSGDERLLVRPQTRQRVFDAVERLGYQPNLSARALKTSRAMAIGMVVPDFAHSGFGLIAAGADNRARDLGYVFLLATGTIEDRLPLLHGRVDGVLYSIATTDHETPSRLPEGMPRLLVARKEPRLGPSIVADDEAYGRVATTHLLELGHRRIGHVIADEANDASRRRSAGHIATMNAAEVPAPPELTISASVDEAGGYAAVSELRAGPAPPTALIAASSRWAVGALAACADLGLEVPRDLSIVTFSDLPIVDFTRPQLTTVEAPYASLGGQAVDLLLRVVEGEPVGDVVIDDPPRLLVRGSTAPAAAS